MLCLPGLTPVVNVDQATGEIGGSVLHSGENVPSLASFSKWGNECPCWRKLIVQAVVHAVEADQQHPLELGLFQAPRPFEKSQQGAEREGQEIEDGQDEGRENEEKRTDESETRPRTDIAGQGRAKSMVNNRISLILRMSNFTIICQGSTQRQCKPH